MSLNICCPTIVSALTSGPSQPEAQGFQPAGTSDMVDLFTGDFSYNIPLFELPGPNGGYPFNLSYQSGITMDMEASWVGLGFSLNPGAINRQMRGLPDEFKGDTIFTKMAINPSVTVGLGAGVSLEVFGAGKEVGTVGLGVTYNSFKGYGYSIDGSLGFSTSVGSGMTSGIGLNVKLDSKEGVSASPSLSLGGKMGSVGLSVGYNSKAGMDNVSVEASANVATYKMEKNVRTGKEVKTKRNTAVGTGTTLSLAHPGYTPQVSVPMRNLNISAKFSPGGSWWGIFAKGYIKGFYAEQWLHNNKKRIPSKAFGYLNYQDAVGDENAVLDFNREKEGIVSKESPNLAIPSLTYDVYSVTGQGISAMYRPMRNDRGIIYDPQTTSISVGGSVGADVGPAASHVGVNLSVNHTKSTSGLWTDANSMISSSGFQTKGVGEAYEPVYFKVHGENTSESLGTLDDVGGTSAVRVKLTGRDNSVNASGTLEKQNWSKAAPSPGATDRSRKTRTQVIQTITNGELLSGTEELIPHLKVQYIDANNNVTPFNRAGLPKHHIAAFTALTPEGLRYNYGIPAYNLTQEELNFSAKKQMGDTKVEVGPNNTAGDPKYDYANTDQYLKRAELPKFAHSFLLTSIIGPDYVDVTGNGVTEDDLGYWVNFTYKKTAGEGDPFKWRDPFSKAHFQEGWKTDPRDDKGSFVYGEKEIWYLVKAETKSHIASFTLEERQDGKGVNTKLQNNDDTGKPLYALNEVRLYTRISGSNLPIKVVRFTYDYTLCKGIVNGTTGNGKLTLRQLWFEYGNSQRGRFNPYVFNYHDFNPDYDQHAYDRWGNYKPYPSGDFLHNVDFPYAEQDPALQEAINNRASSWSLREIQLPSGGKIIVDYESDDYAYVQHLQAMQMTDIVNPDGTPGDGEFLLNDDAKIKFKLEQPFALPSDLSPAEQRNEVLKYLDTRRKQLFFKANINLHTASEDLYEYVSGYADIDFSPSAVMELYKDTNGKYAYGSFYLVKEDGHHPFSMRAWQHLRTNQPELANSGKKLKQTDDTGERVSQIKGIGNVFTQIRQMFEGFNRYCSDKGWGREVMAGKSWVRLNSPDKKKYGGGLRVRQITMQDSWAGDEEGIYGQLYEYTKVEGNDTISSGVAAYEPIIGGEENPFRYAKKFVESVPLRSDNNLYFEYPINESYYPGPQIGYSTVTVSSLSAASLAGKKLKNITLSNNKNLFPKKGPDISYGTSGVTVHEFYTAREFPVITEETEKDNKPYRLSVAIPFVGNVTISNLSTSQGYSIITNDMHGKQKQVSTYRQDRQGIVEPYPISWVKYNYVKEQKTYDREKISQLSAQFKTNADGTLSLASKNEISNASIPKFSLGQENEFFMDMRQHEDNTWEGGVNINVDILYILWLTVPAYVPWPSVGKNSQRLRTVVTNKIIFKSGILESTEAYDGGSSVVTQNLKWDKLTGAVLLTKVNNNFDAPVYSFTVPAYSQFQGMGAAYQNIGLTFAISGVEKTEANGSVYSFKPGTLGEKLSPGDELLLYPNTGEFTSPVSRVVFTGMEDGDYVLYSKTQLNALSYKAMIIRSGYRNQLSISAGSITGLVDPTVTGATKTYSKTISLPGN